MLKCTHVNDVGVKCLPGSSGSSPQASPSPLSSSSPTQRSSQSTNMPLLQPKAQPVKKPPSQLGGQQHCATKQLIPIVAVLGVVCLILLMAVLGETIAIVILQRKLKKKEDFREG